jgi:hypothetical protein
LSVDHLGTTHDRLDDSQITPAAGVSLRRDPEYLLIQRSLASLAGALFWRPTSDDSAVNTITTGFVVIIVLPDVPLTISAAFS